MNDFYLVWHNIKYLNIIWWCYFPRGKTNAIKELNDVFLIICIIFINTNTLYICIYRQLRVHGKSFWFIVLACEKRSSLIGQLILWFQTLLHTAWGGHRQQLCFSIDLIGQLFTVSAETVLSNYFLAFFLFQCFLLHY